ncbi:TonB-dependent receptor [Brevundimonas intermedia]|uniref:TonB-dependent receptor n=1 Tax=Brevundimonas intermedia TaxID=74315 RepID=A0A4Y9RTQ7_9CAUL|nr:TonB-dependent receptor [Brevundimonas intermedia]TFW12510.1 TonB-dependent receptor [Brevundimonas intermedia]
MNCSRKNLLATTIIAGMAIMAPSLAMAQSQTSQNQQAQEEAAQVEEVVVTGTRIRRSEYSSSQPIQVITSEQAALEGLADTTEILQSSSAANNATQINNFFTGFVTTGGPGVNTISLRGLGEQRTLVLVNGRRVGPAGVRGTVGPTDLNTIPSSQIERVEILTDGASSIYGSDAVAGVINIITKTNQDGGNVEFYTNQPLEGGGEEYRVNGSFGKSFDRGYITAGADYYERKELLFGDRDYFQCPQEFNFLDENLTIRGDVIDPTTGTYKCTGTLNAILRTQQATAGIARAGDYIFSSSAVAGGGYTGCDIAGFHLVAGGTGACSITAQPTAVRRAATAEYPLHSDRYDSRTAISPVKRTSLSLFGGYDLTPNIEMFGELLYNKRESEQHSWRQLFPATSPMHTLNPFGGVCNGTSGIACHYTTPVALVNSDDKQEVEYWRGVGGFRGDFQFANRTWDWELAGQYSRSKGTYGGNFFYNDRVEAAAGLLAWFGEDLEGNAGAFRDDEFVAAGNCDLFILQTASACPTGGVNWYSQNLVENGQLTAEEEAFLLGYETGTTTYEHSYIEGVISGELFNLPAGPLGVALGFHVRKEEIDDNPGEQQRNGNLWGQTAAGRTTGSDTVKELFGELDIPLLRALPLANELTLNVSGRYSDYDSYGENSTYKVGLNWAITPEYRLRASYGTSFRAPALYELFLANQTSFLAQTNIDPCINYQDSSNDVLKANCLASGVPEEYGAAGASSALITTGGGAGILDPETAKSTSVGFIWTPSFTNLSIALDYWKIEINDQVAQFGAGNIVSGCLTSENFPNEALCQLFTRDLNPDSTRYLQILDVNDSYVNISQQMSEGLDLNVRYTKEFAAGDLTLNARASYILDWTQQTFGDAEASQLEGQIGNPELNGQASARFDRGDWTGFYSIDFVGETDNAPFFAVPGNTGTYLGQPVWYQRATPFYMSHNMSIRRRMDDVTIQLGIRNIFDENPPLVSAQSGSSRIGNTPLASQYDWQGRSATFTVSYSF